MAKSRAKQWDDTLPKKGSAAWKEASEDQKKEALLHATQFIDTLPFKGQHLRLAQALAWPRKGVFKEDGTPVTEVPEEVKEATALVAGFILAKIPFDVPAVAWVMAKLGPLIEDGNDISKHRKSWH
jgi:hypothetical protein